MGLVDSWPMLTPSVIPRQLTNTCTTQIRYFGYTWALTRPTCHIQALHVLLVICWVEICCKFLMTRPTCHLQKKNCKCFSRFSRNSSALFLVLPRFLEYIRICQVVELRPRLFGFSVLFPYVVWDTMATNMDISTPSNEASLSMVNPFSTFPTSEIVEENVDRLLTWKI